MMPWNDEMEDRFATPQEACREYAANVGREDRARPWVLTDYDTWEPNPFYVGPKCMRAVTPDTDDVEFLDAHAGCCDAGTCLLGYGAPVYGPVFRPPTEVNDADIPF